MAGCELCPRRCGAERDSGGIGICGASGTMRIARAAPHMWEEPPISGICGSGTIFFTGCSLGCVFCQNRDISRSGTVGRQINPEGLAAVMAELEAQDVHNINFVTGTHFIPQITESLKIYRPGIPIVWNSGGYETAEAVELLAPWVDIWLPDYKYGLPSPAEKYSAAPDYPEVAMAALKLMRAHQPENIYDGGGTLRKGMIIRHLVLPLNVRNSIAALERIACELPGVPVSLMSQYTPVSVDPRYPELNRPITAREYGKVLQRMEELELEGFAQERDSSAGEFIPKWEL